MSFAQHLRSNRGAVMCNCASQRNDADRASIENHPANAGITAILCPPAVPNSLPGSIGPWSNFKNLPDADWVESAAPAMKQRVEMHISQLTVASLLSLAVISLAGSTQAAKAATPLALCNADAERICPGVAPGGGKIIACLKQHKDDVSIGCAKALKAMKAKKGK